MTLTPSILSMTDTSFHLSQTTASMGSKQKDTNYSTMIVPYSTVALVLLPQIARAVQVEIHCSFDTPTGDPIRLSSRSSWSVSLCSRPP